MSALSAVLRELAGNFLRGRRERAIDAQYERAYAGVEDPLGKDFEGWEKEGVLTHRRKPAGSDPFPK
jgi:hypothetical protein